MPPAAAREEQDMETITNLIKDTPIPKMVKVRPVSYTHLDVYKRQPLLPGDDGNRLTGG